MAIPVKITGPNEITVPFIAGPDLESVELTGRRLFSTGRHTDAYMFIPPPHWVAQRWTKPVILDKGWPKMNPQPTPLPKER